MNEFGKMNQFTSDTQALTGAATGPPNQLSKVDIVQSMALLPEGFVPGDNDVICGRGRKCFNHSGNERFRVIVSGYLDQYSSATSKLEKSYMLSDIVAQVRKCSPNGGFVKKCPESKRFYEVGCFLAREKTSQAFRDALHDQYKSSNSAKKKRRQVSQASKLQKAYSASNIGYDASSEPLDAYTPSISNMRVERRRSFNIESDPMIDSMDISEFGNKRRALTLQGFRSSGSARSVVDFRRTGPDVEVGAWFNRSCPNLSVDEKTFQDFSETSESSELESHHKSFADQYPNSSRIAHNPFLAAKPYVSRSSQSLMSVEESIPEELEEYRGFEDRAMDEGRELTMERLLLQPEAAPSDCHLLASLSKLIHNVDIDGDPFAPVPIPDMRRH
jgi:hypothetical protein